MAPSIRPGEVVVLKPAETPRVGSVALTIQQGRVIVHRLVVKTSHLVITRGDANLIPDPPDPAIEILAVIDSPSRTEFLPSWSQRLLLSVIRPLAFSPSLATFVIRVLRRLARDLVGTGSPVEARPVEQDQCEKNPRVEDPHRIPDCDVS